MKVVCMIPARYGSKRFEGKALAELHGKPLIQHVYERARQATGLALVAVVTDDERIFEVVQGFGGEAIMSSPKLRTGTDRIAKACERLDIGERDIVVNVQGDQPYIRPEHIKQVVSVLKGETMGAAMATLAYKVTRAEEIADVNAVKVVFDNSFHAIYFSRCSIPYRVNDLNIPYYKHLGIYAYRRWFLQEYANTPEGVLERAESLEQLRAIENGYKIKVGLTDIDSPSIDTPADLRRVHDIVNEHGGCAG